MANLVYDPTKDRKKAKQNSGELTKATQSVEAKAAKIEKPLRKPHSVKREEKAPVAPAPTPAPTETTKPAKPAKVVIPDAELLDLTAENFVVVMGKLGGKDVSTAQMLPYFKIVKEPKPANRWPKLRAMAKKLAAETPPKVLIVFQKDINEYRYDLP